MKVNKCEVPILIEPDLFKDNRGWFFESYNEDKLNLGLRFIQDNHSYSKKKGTLRGLHLQLPPFEQAKLIRVVRGKILDILVDLRPSSSDYLKHFTYQLDASNKNTLYVPKGFAHGFITLEDDTEVLYKVDNNYSPKHEVTIKYDDEKLGINWHFNYKYITISEKDKNGLSLEEVIVKLGGN